MHCRQERARVRTTTTISRKPNGRWGSTRTTTNGVETTKQYGENENRPVWREHRCLRSRRRMCADQKTADRTSRLLFGDWRSCVADREKERHCEPNRTGRRRTRALLAAIIDTTRVLRVRISARVYNRYVSAAAEKKRSSRWGFATPAQHARPAARERATALDLSYGLPRRKSPLARLLLLLAASARRSREPPRRRCCCCCCCRRR